jgi:hypothetical protein
MKGYLILPMIMIFSGLIALGFAIGGAAYDQPVPPPPTLSVGTAGPFTVSQDLSILGQFIPGKSQQTLVTAQLAACADLEVGRSYVDTYTSVGQLYGVAGQLREFLVTQAVNTWCSDQDDKVGV